MPDQGEQGNETGPARRGGGPRALATPLDAVTRRVLGRRGFAEAGLITEWSTIVGEELATACRPDRLSFPPARRDGATLRVRVAGGIATELQHLEPVLLERINGYFGYRAVSRLMLVHLPPARGSAGGHENRDNQAARVCDASTRATVEAAVENVSDPELRGALARLAQALISSGGSSRKR